MRKENSYIQEKAHKAIIRFFTRNFAGQERMAGYIQSAERKKPVTKNTLPNKIVLQN